MKMKLFILILAAFIFKVEAVGAQMQMPEPSVNEVNAVDAKDIKEQAQANGLVEVGNKICPVTGEKVGMDGEEIVKQEYNGKIYNLCCKMCFKDFNKDPEKYSKIAEDEVMKAEKDSSDKKVEAQKKIQ